MKEIFCDGSCLGNPGPGGWGVLVKQKDLTVEVYSHSPKTTNNQMELQAAIVAAQFVNSTETVSIYTDSQYVIKGLTEWMVGWKKRNWITATKEPVKNKELWQELDKTITGKKINWIWVKAHNGHPENEIVDKLAKIGSSGKSNAHMLAEFIHKFDLQENPIKPSPVKLHSLIRNKRGDIFIVMNDKAIIYPEKEAFMLVDKNNKSFFIDKESLYSEFILAKDENSFKLAFEAQNFIVEKETKKLAIISKNCKHHIIKKYESAVCDNCNKDFGWYCEVSPDHTCHYYSNDRKVELINGEKVGVPPEHDDRYETDDACIFCLEPEERK